MPPPPVVVGAYRDEGVHLGSRPPTGPPLDRPVPRLEPRPEKPSRRCPPAARTAKHRSLCKAAKEPMEHDYGRNGYQTPLRRLKIVVRTMALSSPYATLATASPTTTGQAVTTKTITKANIAATLHHETGLPRTECGELLKSVLDVISDNLINGETVKISSFGRFAVKQKGQRIGRNPKTLESFMIAPRRIVTFRPSSKLK